MSGITTAFWGMTINNYDETDLALVQNAYPDYMREIIHTLEKGEEGTPHIQAWIKLQRQQRLSFVKKLFPRGHFKPLTSDEYIANTKKYAQKLDDTAVAGAVHKFNLPIPDVVRELQVVIKEAFYYYADKDKRIYDTSDHEILAMVQVEQHNRVRENPQLAKLYVSATYKAVVKEYLRDIAVRVWEAEYSKDTHTHTHSEKKLSRQGGITDDATERDDASEGEDAEESGSEGQEDCEDYSEGSGSDDETDSEGGDYSVGEDSSGEED